MPPTVVREHILEDIQIQAYFLEEALQAILHTILFLRAPTNNVKGKDRYCERLLPLIYTTCGIVDIDQTISSSIEIFKKSFATNSPKSYRGEIILGFYEKREIKEWGGFVVRHENVYFERWKLPLTVNLDRKPSSSQLSSDSPEGTTDENRIEQKQAFDRAYNAVTKTIMNILSLASSSEHVPLTDYDFEITVNPLATSGIYSGNSESGSVKASGSQPSSRGGASPSPSVPIPINPNNNLSSPATRLFPHANI